VDSSIFTPADRGESRRRLGLQPEGRWIAAAGHLIPLKGFDRLIAAVHRIKPEFNEPLQLAIAGEGGFDQPYETALRGLPATLGLATQVRFCGRLPQAELASLMCAADVFCLASEREGWPNVVHEAMSCGTPVVAANVGAIPEMIPDAGYGRVVAPKDAAALAGGLREALTTQWDRERISHFAQSRGWQQVASELAAEWRASAAGR
jgi:glycosyltransferase involved in cell wall biosynthesis